MCLLYPILHAQRDGYETYFMVDAVGGATTLAHETAIKRMIQPGSQPVTLNSLITEWIRDWEKSPHGAAIQQHLEWYAPEIEKVRARLRETPFEPVAI